MIIASDLEWTKQRIDVLGIAWEHGLKCTAVERTDQTMAQYLAILRQADLVVGQNYLDADCMQLRKEGIDVDWLVPKVFDTRIAMHAIHGHLAGTGSFDLRSMVLLLGGRQGQRFPLDWKRYESDLHATCALDSAAAGWLYPTLIRQIRAAHLEATVAIGHQVSPIFALMREQGVRLDPAVLTKIYDARKAKTRETVERYHLWEDRGKKVIKRVPTWRSDKILDLCQQQFGIRPKDRQRKTWEKLSKDASLSPAAKEFIDAIIDLGKGANDAHWLGDAEETDEGIDFSKVGSDGCIHPRYDLCGSPDRAIAASPNIQNFPRPGEDPRPIPLRSAVIPLHADHVILGVDFSSVETITNAIESDDWDRAQAALHGRITHEGTAALVGNAMGLTLTRQQGKAINHGFDKGESPYNLARTLFKTDRPSRQHVLQAQQMFQGMLKEYPKTNTFRDALWERAMDNPLTVTNSFGRRLMCFSRAKYGESEGFRAQHNPAKKYWCSCAECSPRRDRWKYAISFLGRSSAFDALLRKMAVIWEEKRIDGFSLPYLEVHDELDYSVDLTKAEHYAKIVKMTFEEPIPELGGISLPASAVIGKSWADAH